MARFEGKVALVTGGARGLGRAVVDRFATEGASVGILSYHEESAERAVAEVVEAGGAAVAIAGDVADEASVRRAVEGVVEAFGKLDIMVNNAGAITVGQAVDTSVEAWDRVMAVNLRGTFLGATEAARQMIRQGTGGRILNCSSGAGRRGNASIAPYAASKFGVIGFTQSLAVELAPHKITVNAYCPGHVTSTPMWDFLDGEFGRLSDAPPGAIKEAVAHEAPLDRVGEASEIAALVAFLASDESAFITGESILIDGGLVRF